MYRGPNLIQAIRENDIATFKTFILDNSELFNNAHYAKINVSKFLNETVRHGQIELVEFFFTVAPFTEEEKKEFLFKTITFHIENINNDKVHHLFNQYPFLLDYKNEDKETTLSFSLNSSNAEIFVFLLNKNINSIHKLNKEVAQFLINSYLSETDDEQTLTIEKNILAHLDQNDIKNINKYLNHPDLEYASSVIPQIKEVLQSIYEKIEMEKNIKPVNKVHKIKV
jgi:hypothetical protein